MTPVFGRLLAAGWWRCAVGGLLLGLAPLAPAADGDWPQWRGPNRDGRVDGIAWPDSLGSNRLQQVWQVPLGPGYSGPIVGGDRVFVTETVAKKDEVVRALDRATGRELWRAQWAGAMSVPFFAKSNGDWIRATPALDGDRLYVAGMRDVLVCLDATSGKEVWRVDFTKQFKTPLPSFGFVSSPLIDGNRLYVQAGAAVVCLDKRDAKVLWRSLADEGGMWGSAFSSPALAMIGGTNQLLAQTRTQLAGLDPVDGRVLWTNEIKAFRGMNILTPIALGDRVFTSAYGGQSLALDLHQAGGKWTATQAWSYKAQGYMSTPVVLDRHAYLHLRSQRVICLNLETGRETWTSPRTFGKYWSLVSQGGRILALDERGILFLLRADPQRFEELDSRKISDSETWAHLAVAGNLLLIRSLDDVTAWRWQ